MRSEWGFELRGGLEMIRVKTALLRRGAVCVFAAALAAMLAACSSATTAQLTTGSDDVRYDADRAQKSLEALEAQRSRESGATKVDADATAENVAERLPYIGLPESLIDKTWLGVPDRVGEVIDSGKFKGGTPYYWNAQNGSGDMLFDAIVVDGVVVNVSKYNLAKNYWCDATGTIRMLPDRTASGAQVDGGTRQFVPQEDPSDYDSPDEYADAAEDEFAAHGSSNPWQDAFDYWESNVG